MPGQHIGYIRVSTTEQNTARQLDGLNLDRVFTDRLSGRNRDRPELQAMILYARDGDQVTVHSMDRLARNLDDLRRIVRELNTKGVRVTFIKESLTFVGDDSPMSNLLLSVMGAFAEFERSLIHERQREGIALAKTRGVYRGRKPALTTDQALDLRRRAAAGQSMTALARDFGISRATAYGYVKSVWSQVAAADDEETDV